MSNSIKEIIFKFLFVFVFLSAIGYFIKWLDLGVGRAFAMAVGISIVELAACLYKKYRKKS